MVCNEMMDIVTALPPADGEAAAEVGDEEGNEGIDDKVMGDSTMASIVCCKHYLMLEGSQSWCVRRRVKRQGQVWSIPKTVQGNMQRSNTIRNVMLQERLRTGGSIEWLLCHTRNSDSRKILHL